MPQKEKHIKCNQSPFMNKQLKKEIMTQLFFLINIGKIIVPEISLPIKDREIYVLSSWENLRRFSTIILM